MHTWINVTEKYSKWFLKMCVLLWDLKPTLSALGAIALPTRPHHPILFVEMLKGEMKECHIRLITGYLHGVFCWAWIFYITVIIVCLKCKFCGYYVGFFSNWALSGRHLFLIYSSVTFFFREQILFKLGKSQKCLVFSILSSKQIAFAREEYNYWHKYEKKS